MRRTALTRKTPIRAKRKQPRRRAAPRWDSSEWADADLILSARAGYVCERCGRECGPLERHHRKRRRDGGESYPNIVHVGRPCHEQIHAHPALARKFGWIVSVNRDPVCVPILWRLREWMLLTEDGGKVDAFVPADDAHE